MDEKKRYLLKYITKEQAKRFADNRGSIKPKTMTITADTERAAIYAFWTSKKGPVADHVVSVKELSTPADLVDEAQFKIGWYDACGKRRYKDAESKAEALDLIAQLMDFPGPISVNQTKTNR